MDSIKIKFSWSYANHICTSNYVYPSILSKSFQNSETSQSIGALFSNMFGFWYNLVFALLIIILHFSILQLQFLQIKWLMI
jgi:hypothetical protein